VDVDPDAASGSPTRAIVRQTGSAGAGTIRGRGRIMTLMSERAESYANLALVETPKPGRMKRLFAANSARGNRRHEVAVRDYKLDLFGRLSGSVVEIGPGVGNNLRYFPRDIAWTGIEPNPFMHRYLHERADRLGLNIELREGTVERVDLESDSVDAVACSLVLCSVPNVGRALAEVRRILRPGGRFVFVEHVAAAGGTFAHRAQRWAAPLMRIMGDGCRLDRETWRDILDGGFSEVRIEHFGLPLWLGGPHIAGYAIK
jgi:ubiquinone/menaquinone biosynthesis C-methylase UbiE